MTKSCRSQKVKKHLYIIHQCFFLFFSHFLNYISCEYKMSVYPTTFMAAEHCAQCLVVCASPHGGLGDLQRMIDEDLPE